MKHEEAKVLKHKGTKTQRHEVFLFHAKLAKEQGRKDFETHCRKFFHKTKLLIIGKCFQPFELIEPIEPLELFLRQRHEGAKARSFFVSRKARKGARMQRF